MKRVRVKICGVTSLDEAQAALDLGADMIGFNFYPRSARCVKLELAAEIIASLPPYAVCVGVFVNEEPERVTGIASRAGLSAVQIHGDETPDYCASLKGFKVIKGIRVSDGFEPASVSHYPVGAILLDAGVKGLYGGTGEKFDWRIAVECKQYAPIILAGGLSPGNVAEAIACVEPLAVDVCSGVESEPGRKDLTKLRTFMEEVERANRLLAAGG